MLALNQTEPGQPSQPSASSAQPDFSGPGTEIATQNGAPKKRTAGIGLKIKPDPSRPFHRTPQVSKSVDSTKPPARMGGRNGSVAKGALGFHYPKFILIYF